MNKSDSTNAPKKQSHSVGTDASGREPFAKRMLASKFVETTFPSRLKQWSNIAHAGDLGIVVGNYGVDLNGIVSALALSLSGGEKLFGLAVKQVCKVIVVPAGTAPRRFLKSLKANLRGQDIEPPETLSCVVLSTFAAKSLYEFDAAAFSHCIGDTWDVLLVDGNSAGVLLVGDRTDLSPMFAKWVYQQQTLGKTVIVVYGAPGPDWKRHVGSKVMSADFSIQLLSQVDNSDDRSSKFRLKLESVHRAKKGPLELDVVMTTDEHGGALWAHQKIETPDGDERIARAKKMHGKGKTKTEIGEKFGVHRSTVSRWLKQ